MTLTADELSDIRDCIEDLLPDTCTIQTVTQSSDGMGGWTESWANTHTGVPCRVWRKEGNEREVGDQTAEVTRWVLTVAWDQAVDATMRVVHAGHTYQVNDVNDTGSERGERRAWLTRIQ